MDDGPMYQATRIGLCSKLEDGLVMNDLYPLARLGSAQTLLALAWSRRVSATTRMLSRRLAF
jgi:hypothetical protein